MTDRFKTLISTVMLLAVVGSIGLATVTGGAAAADVEIGNETVAVDDNTDSAFAEVNNTATTDANVTIEYVGVDADGNDTSVLATNNVVATADSETLDEYADVNASKYEKIRITTTLDNTTADQSNVSVSVGTFQKLSGGGGGSSSGLGTNVWLLLGALVAGMILLRD